MVYIYITKFWLVAFFCEKIHNVALNAFMGPAGIFQLKMVSWSGKS